MLHDAWVTVKFWLEEQWWHISRHSDELKAWALFILSLAALVFVLGFSAGLMLG
jgi:hypothetical protein